MMKKIPPARPVVRSFKQLNEATNEIVLLRQQQQQAEAGLESALAEVRRQHAKNFLVETSDGPLAISERLARLETAVSRFCKANNTYAETGSIRTPAARIAPFHAAGGIEFRDGHNRRTAAQAYAAQPGFRDAINRLLKRFGLLGRIVLTPDLDWDGLKRSLRNGTLTPAEIEPLGMIWTGGPRPKIRTVKKDNNESS